jgi:hypothetical protein
MRKLWQFDVDVPMEGWFPTKMAVTDLADLAKTGHQFLDPCLIGTFVEKWHEETLSFHMPNLIGSDPADAAKEITLLITLRTRIRSRF